MATVTIPERYNASLLLDRNLEAGRQDTTAILCEDESRDLRRAVRAGVRRGRRAARSRRPARRARAARDGRLPLVPGCLPRGDADRSRAGSGQPALRAGRLLLLRRGQRRAARDRRCGVRGEGARAEVSCSSTSSSRRRSFRRSTRSATTWRSGCTAPARQVARRGSSTCTAISSSRARRTLDTSSGSPKRDVTLLDDEALPRVRPREQPLLSRTGRVRRRFSCAVARRRTPSSRRSSGSAPRCSSRCRRSTTRCSRRADERRLLVGAAVRLRRGASSRRGLAPLERRGTGS